MIWQSEAFLYGLMISNVLGIGLALLWAWRRGHLSDLEAAGDVLFEESAPASIQSGASHSGRES